MGVRGMNLLRPRTMVSTSGSSGIDRPPELLGWGKLGYVFDLSKLDWQGRFYLFFSMLVICRWVFIASGLVGGGFLKAYLLVY